MTVRKFHEAMKYAKTGRASPGWDGLQAWIDIKNNDLYEGVSYGKSKGWSSRMLKKEYVAFRNQVLRELPEYDESGKMNEANHFIIQCLRIPIKNQLTERRLVQVGYNIGQFKASEHEYPQEYVAKFYELELDSISTYV